MNKIPQFKNKDLRRKGYVLISDFLLPIHTKGILEYRQAMRKIKDNQKFPMKTTIADEDEKKALSNFGYDVSKFGVSIKRIDESSPEYKEFELKMEKMNLFFKIAMNVDLKYPITSGELLWEHLELKSEDDYLGITEWLSNLGIESNECEYILKEIEAIKKLGLKDYDEWIPKTGLFKDLLEDDTNGEQGS